MATISKTDLIERIAAKLKTDKASARRHLEQLIAEVHSAVQNGEEIIIRDLLSIKKVFRSARTARNPRTGEAVPVPAKQTIAVKPAAALVAKAADPAGGTASGGQPAAAAPSTPVTP